jgi:hypothetical protein
VALGDAVLAPAMLRSRMARFLVHERGQRRPSMSSIWQPSMCAIFGLTKLVSACASISQMPSSALCDAPEALLAAFERGQLAFRLLQHQAQRLAVRSALPAG